jgi:hypothetical protein
MKKPVPVFVNEQLQSDEEIYASWFFEELKAKGYITKIIYQPEPFTLFDGAEFDWIKDIPTKKDPLRKEFKTSTMLSPAIYTPDILVFWSHKAKNLFYSIDEPQSSTCKLFIAHYVTGNLISDIPYSYIEVKPVFDDNNMTREVVIKHKWVYQRYGAYVNMFIRNKVMPKLFTPEKYIKDQVYQKAYTSKKEKKVFKAGESKIKWKVQTLEEYLSNLKTNERTQLQL